jgi:hypothetical protein
MGDPEDPYPCSERVIHLQPSMDQDSLKKWEHKKTAGAKRQKKNIQKRIKKEKMEVKGNCDVMWCDAGTTPMEGRLSGRRILSLHLHLYELRGRKLLAFTLLPFWWVLYKHPSAVPQTSGPIVHRSQNSKTPSPSTTHTLSHSHSHSRTDSP